ncbi:(2E,6E)-farnesyl diphosphate synthase [Atopomonas sediminilitoris]|uniref:(2E,6E)-farnesyl diphosphate synthase n=1 Tax=Atopomonas sediminilitoris TaxID=2919919 RepID=UPI001F4EA1F3|nr:farnesyl diphosphate synthase [Atopomonas sediminilitoris]MCJ8170185.1 (2E,6E)-farnesyl diphosphate synthase [Atopomonas sediminilitoris]
MIDAYLSRCRERLQPQLQQLFQAPLPALSTLYQAMDYSVSNGGKRVRPLLAYASCEALGGQMTDADAAACAVELIHAYSLVHDDLPAMDDDNLRRGQPTCHIAFDEATAILAGDALQALAFECLSDSQRNPLSAELRLQQTLELARAAGPAGMVGGQAIDLAAVGSTLTQPALEQMHRHKTGALIVASVRLGALASGNASARDLEQLSHYAQAIGLAFQVQDDILDIESDTATLGKQQGADIARDKPTYPALLGLQAAKAYAHELEQQALTAIAHFDQRAEPLRALAQYIISRQH